MFCPHLQLLAHILEAVLETTGISTNLLLHFKTVTTDKHQDPAPEFNPETGTV